MAPTKNRIIPPHTHLGIRSFIATYILMICVRIAEGTYFNGVTRTLERRFDLRSRTLGIVTSLNDVVIVAFVLVIGNFGKRAHIPRTLSLCALAMAASSLCNAMPYFIYGPLKIHSRYKIKMYY